MPPAWKELFQQTRQQADLWVEAFMMENHHNIPKKIKDVEFKQTFPEFHHICFYNISCVMWIYSAPDTIRAF